MSLLRRSSVGRSGFGWSGFGWFRLQRLGAYAVRSLYASVLVATLLILSVSFLVFKYISVQIQRTEVDRVYDHMDLLQIEEARDYLRDGGKEGLRKYMTRLDRLFGGKHLLLDGRGVDLLSGKDMSFLLPQPRVEVRREVMHGWWVLAHRSPDGENWLMALRPADHPNPWMFLPYYFLVIGAMSVLCWLVAVGVVAPLRRIAAGMARFGEGDLGTRVPMKREDEIGRLGRSFNQMAEQLGTLIESERTLLGDISHELRGPLARLKLGVKLARTSADKAGSLDRIERDIDRLTSILSDVVEITRVEGDPALKETDRVALQGVVEEIVHDCELEAGLRGCALEVEGRLAGMVEGNPELLRRAVENVIRNAVRHAPDRSVIWVGLSEMEGTASISVRDFGTGVPEEALTRIFDPFFRVEKARDAKSGGSGLGLSIAKRAVLLHRGEIEARNAEPGLEVTIRIPLMAGVVGDGVGERALVRGL